MEKMVILQDNPLIYYMLFSNLAFFVKFSLKILDFRELALYLVGFVFSGFFKVFSKSLFAHVNTFLYWFATSVSELL